RGRQVEEEDRRLDACVCSPREKLFEIFSGLSLTARQYMPSLHRSSREKSTKKRADVPRGRPSKEFLAFGKGPFSNRVRAGLPRWFCGAGRYGRREKTPTEEPMTKPTTTLTTIGIAVAATALAALA